MPRRVRPKPSLLAPAGQFIKRLSNQPARLRRRILMAAFWTGLLFFLYSLMSGSYGVPRIVSLELERKALKEANRRQLTHLIDLARERDLLRSDSSYIEYIARTKYHMAYPNETVYRFRGR